MSTSRRLSRDLRLRPRDGPRETASSRSPVFPSSPRPMSGSEPREFGGKPMSVVVERNGERVETSVVPTVESARWRGPDRGRHHRLTNLRRECRCRQRGVTRLRSGLPTRRSHCGRRFTARQRSLCTSFALTSAVRIDRSGRSCPRWGTGHRFARRTEPRGRGRPARATGIGSDG